MQKKPDLFLVLMFQSLLTVMALSVTRFFIACLLLSSPFSYPLCPSGIRFGAQPGAGVPKDGMHVQSSDLLQGDSSAEGSGGRAGQEVQEGSHTGNWGWSQ